MKILAFAASSSKNSINKQLVTYAASQFKASEVELLDLNDYELPLFSVDKEEEIGSPELAQNFYNKITKSDAIIISFAEHNGSYTAAYKNLFDWCSRINQKLFQDKPMIMLSTSPGARGSASVLAQAVQSAQYFAGDVKGSYSLPSFFDNFNSENQSISNPEHDQAFKTELSKLLG